MVNEQQIKKIIDELVTPYNVKCGDGYISPSERAEQFDPSTFNEELYDNDGELMHGIGTSALVSPIGELQQQQEDLQNTIDYTHLENLSALMWNSGDWFKLLNEYIRDGEWEKFIPEGMTKDELLNGFEFGSDYEIYEFFKNGGDVNEMFDLNDPTDRKLYDEYLKYEPMTVTLPQMADTLKNAIKKSSLLEDTVVYRLGYFDESIEVGKSGVLKGFTSSTYNPKFIDYMKENYDWMGSDDYVIKIYAPKGTNGSVFGNNNFGDGDKESELLFNDGQKYVVLSRDAENKTAEILLY